MGLFDRFRSGRRKKEQSDEKTIKQSGEMTIEELRRIEDEKNKKRLEESRKVEEITKQANSELSDIMNGEAARRLASHGASFLNEVLESKKDPAEEALIKQNVENLRRRIAESERQKEESKKFYEEAAAEYDREQKQEQEERDKKRQEEADKDFYKLKQEQEERNKKILEEVRKSEEIRKEDLKKQQEIMNGPAAQKIAAYSVSILNNIDAIAKRLNLGSENSQTKAAKQDDKEIEKPVSESSKKEKPIEKKIPEVKKQEERSVKAEEIKKVVPEPPKKEEKIVKEEKIEKKIPEAQKQDVAKNTKDEEIKRKISESQKQHYNELNATMNANSSKKSPKPTTVSMASLDDFFGTEKLSQELANKDSDYAYVTYLKPVSSTEMNHKGELVQFNRPSYEGEVDLISATELERLNQDFPDNIKGKVIKYGDLENVLSYIFDGLKKDYSKLDMNDDRCKDKMQYLDSFAIDGKLTADHQDESSLSDLANKVFNFQESVRDLQYNRIKHSKKNTVRI